MLRIMAVIWLITSYTFLLMAGLNIFYGINKDKGTNTFHFATTKKKLTQTLRLAPRQHT